MQSNLLSLILVFLMSFISSVGFAQKQIIHQNLKQDTLKVNRGPNSRKFTHAYIIVGGVVPDSKIVDPGVHRSFAGQH